MNDAMKARLAALGYTGANQDMLDTHLKTFTYPDEIRKELMQMGESFWDSASGPSLYLPFADKGAGEVDTKEVFGATPTFTRATTATTVDRTGRIVSVGSGVPRSYYDPTSLTYLGYLAEGARTNLCLQSEDLSTTWANAFTPVLTTNFAVAPDGTTTADKLEDDDAVNFEGKTQIITVANDSLTHTTSLFIKKTVGATNTVGVNSSLSGGTSLSSHMRINTNSGVAVGVGGGPGAHPAPTVTVQEFNDYWRVSWSITNNTSGNTTLNIGLYPATSTNVGDNPGSDVGSATGSAVFWGIQVEKASFVSSYIPTTTVAVARNADLLTYPTAGWLDASAGTVLVQCVSSPSNSADEVYVSLDDGTANERMFMSKTTAPIAAFTVIDGGVTQASVSAGTFSNSTAGTFAAAYKANDFAACLNAGTVGTDTSGTLPTVTTARIGNNVSSVLQPHGPIRFVAYYPRRLDDTHLQMITKHGVKYV